MTSPNSFYRIYRQMNLFFVFFSLLAQPCMCVIVRVCLFACSFCLLLLPSFSSFHFDSLTASSFSAWLFLASLNVCLPVLIGCTNCFVFSLSEYLQFVVLEVWFSFCRSIFLLSVWLLVFFIDVLLCICLHVSLPAHLHAWLSVFL